MARRIDVASGLVIAGAVLLFVSLFLDWWAPELAAWDAFEALDLVLAGIAIVCIMIAAGWRDGRLGQGWLPVLAGVALVTVIVQIADEPPAVFVAANAAIEREEGIWVGLAATLLMALGAAMRFAHVSVALEISPHRSGRGAARREPALHDSEAETGVVGSPPRPAAAPPPPPSPPAAAPPSAAPDATPDEPVGTRRVRRPPPAT